MARLTMAQRRRIPASSFGVPSKAPGPGSYAENDPTHARKALQLIKYAPASSRGRIRRLAAAQGVGKGASKAKASAPSYRKLMGM